jgi:D-proline reductase (dithiol) PrdB
MSILGGMAVDQPMQPERRPENTVSYMERTRELYSSQPAYRWASFDPKHEPPPWTPIAKPLSSLRVALIASGGVHHKEQEPFHFRNDTSQREIPLASDTSDLRVSHFGYDIKDAQIDPGCVLPLRALRELEVEGVIGSLVDPALSFMGGIYSTRLVREEVAPRFLDFVLRQKADLAYLVPA